VGARRIIVDMVLSPGRSGSPFYDELGALVGIHSARLEDDRWPGRPVAIASRLDNWEPLLRLAPYSQR
jgi:hypothetical protein